MKINEILLEANVLNSDQVKQYTNDDTLPPVVKTWFNKHVYRWIINNDRFARPIDSSVPIPAWASDALERGEKVVNIDINAVGNFMLPTFDKIKAWLQWEYEMDPNAKILRKLSQLTVETAFNKATVWKRELDREAAEAAQQRKDDAARAVGKDITGESVVAMDFKDGYQWVLLLSDDCMDAEGKEMQNCVRKDYTDIPTVSIAILNKRLYSLRDPQGEPHVHMLVVTLKEIDGYGKPKKLGKIYEMVREMKGKQNKFPIDKYVPYVKEFILRNDWRVNSDLTRGAGWANSILGDVRFKGEQQKPPRNFRRRQPPGL